MCVCVCVCVCVEQTSLLCSFSMFVLSACGSGTKADVVFVLDTSGSVGADDFGLLKEFVSQVLEEWDIGQDQIRIGVMKFSTSPEVEFQLDEYEDKENLLEAVDSIEYSAGDTDTGMDAATAHVYTYLMSKQLTC